MDHGLGGGDLSLIHACRASWGLLRLSKATSIISTLNGGMLEGFTTPLEICFVNEIAVNNLQEGLPGAPRGSQGSPGGLRGAPRELVKTKGKIKNPRESPPIKNPREWGLKESGGFQEGGTFAFGFARTTGGELPG